MIKFIKNFFGKKNVVKLTDTQHLVLENICYLTDGNLGNDIEVANAVYAIHQTGMFDVFDVNCVANHIKNQARFK